MSKYPIGAWANVHFKDDLPDMVYRYYFSFGKCLDDKDTDEYGVPDVGIFYYCFGGEDELKTFVESSYGEVMGHEFIVEQYELIYKEEDDEQL